MAMTIWLIDSSPLGDLHDADDVWFSRIHRGLVKYLDRHAARAIEVQRHRVSRDLEGNSTGDFRTRVLVVL